MAKILGMKKQQGSNFLPKDHRYNEHDIKDPEGYEWVDVPTQWKTQQTGEGKWNPYKEDSTAPKAVFEDKMTAYSKFK